MDHQLQDTCPPAVTVSGFSSADAFQNQVVGRVAVPQRHVAQHLRRRDVYRLSYLAVKLRGTQTQAG